MTASDPDRRIDVEAVSVYVREQSEPDDDRFLFAYTVTIRNTGEAPAKLISRHWIITDGLGKTQEVRGEGVVGEQPRLEPGQSFQYTSAAMLETPVGSMHGSYQMVTDDGAAFDAEIAPFSLAVPRALN
jgi:ApaG protein